MESELAVVAKHATQAPVDLGAIFADLGIEFCLEPIWSGESGWIERDGPNYRVTVNESEPEQRRRFTAAHELAHYLLHRDLMDHGSRMNRHTDRLFDGAQDNAGSLFTGVHEVQANRLAAQILMPARLVRQMREQDDNVAHLAAKFMVSKQAMEIRLKSLGLLN